MALVKPGGERVEHKVYDTTNRTCYLCHRPVAQVADTYFTYNMSAILCFDHAEADGYHGQLAARENKPFNPMQTVRLLHSSRFVEGANSRRRRQQEGPSVKPVEAELDEGDMIPEVAAFLKKMGKL